MPARSTGSLLVFVPLLASLSLAGCGHIGFYDNPDLSGGETGVKFYTPKPYLLVTRTQVKESPIKAELVYLPDLSKPVYAKAVAGMGSSDLSMTFSNGMLTTFGQKTDPKVAETATGLGGLVTAAGTLATDIATALATRGAVPQSSDVKDVETIKAIVADLGILLNEKAAREALTTGELRTLETARLRLDSIRKTIESPAQHASAEDIGKWLSEVLDTWKKDVRNESPVPTGKVKIVLERLAKLRADLEALVAKNKTAVAERPVVTLYEIDNSSGTTVLREVKETDQ